MANGEYADRLTVSMELTGRRYAAKIGYDMAQPNALVRILMVVFADEKLRRDAITLAQATERPALTALLFSEFGVTLE